MSKTFVLAALLCFSLGILADRLLFADVDDACQVTNWPHHVLAKLPPEEERAATMVGGNIRAGLYLQSGD
jgi:hypothetical protein